MKETLLQLIQGSTLRREEAQRLMTDIAKGKADDNQTAALLMALEMRGATVDELLGLRDGLLATGRQLRLGTDDLLDIVGTGGDGKNTFNISTCAAIVVAAAGYKVAKHGNAAATSVSGASDVLRHLGLVFTDSEDRLRRSLDETNFCYLHAPLFALGMKHVAPVRRALAIPTCFNLLGPLINPARPRYSLHGTATPAQQRLYTLLHQKLGDQYGVVHSHDGYDEISLTSGFRLTTNLFEKVYTPKDLGLDYVRPDDIAGPATQEGAARLFLDVLQGTATRALTDVVVANAACAISVVSPNLSIADSLAQAREALDSRKALHTLQRAIDISRT